MAKRRGARRCGAGGAYGVAVWEMRGKTIRAACSRLAEILASSQAALLDCCGIYRFGPAGPGTVADGLCLWRYDEAIPLERSRAVACFMRRRCRCCGLTSLRVVGSLLVGAGPQRQVGIRDAVWRARDGQLEGAMIEDVVRVAGGSPALSSSAAGYLGEGVGCVERSRSLAQWSCVLG